MRKKRLVLRAAMMLTCGACMYQFGLGACINASNIINPCQTVLAQCTQQQLDFLNRTIPDFRFDPSCTIPGACGDLPFAEFSSGVDGTGPGVRVGGPRGGPP